ncbi:MAG: thioredoxin family protein [Prolixibacteraceae bacterium]|nr:thioredoxin family protein [Prolixibacteraceae bacterium]
MEIKILGTGCAKCKALEATVKKVVAELGIEANVLDEKDVIKIMDYNVMRTPALVIDEKVVSQGKNLTEKEVKNLLCNDNTCSCHN